MEAAEFGDALSAVRDFVRNEVVPREEEIEESDAIPDEIRRAAISMGLFGYTLPAEYGGLALSLHEDVRLAFASRLRDGINSLTDISSSPMLEA